MSGNELRLDVRSAYARELDDDLTEWSQRTGIAVEAWALPKEPLPCHVGETVRGTIRDVLDEVERQGRARTVSIALTVAPSGLRLTVSDDGGGRSAEALRARLLGRCAEFTGLGGRLTVNGVPGEGTTVSGALYPLPRCCGASAH
ncbi:hypothetical protein [Nonomuraea basaltis]|uniref:hypothetical protein n=1 Tax=Nonomuraea basaltis TaxID=2495887 RepID=UPI00110C5EB8|nr:hypothetical protein [Nonomuraea basaltis]TMS00686.1 hypothetical protein EJK15_00020 [Nonomuraea basaltis]